MSLFITRFKELLANSGKMQKDICKDLGISKQKMSNWKTGYTEPNLDDIILLADYFKVSVDYLIGYENEDGSKNTNIVNSFNNVHNSGNITIK